MMHRLRKNVFDGHVRFSACDLPLHDFHSLSTGSLFIMGGHGLRDVGDMVADDRVLWRHGIHLVGCRLNVNRFLMRGRTVNLESRMLSGDAAADRRPRSSVGDRRWLSRGRVRDGL